MLEDVRHAGRVGRRGGKEDREAVVVVGALDVDVPRAGPLVTQLDVGAEALEGLASHDCVAADRARSCVCHVNS